MESKQTWLRHLCNAARLTLHSCFFGVVLHFIHFMHGSLFWQIRKLHRQPSIYRCVCHHMMLLDYISIQEWKKRIVANRCVGVGLVLQLFNILFCWSSEEVRNFYLCFLLLDLATMQRSDKRILGYICDACKRHFACRFAYDRHRRSKFLQGTPCVTAVEQLSDLVAARRAIMSTAMLRTASVSSAVGTKISVNDRITQIMNIPSIFGIITLIM